MDTFPILIQTSNPFNYVIDNVIEVFMFFKQVTISIIYQSFKNIFQIFFVFQLMPTSATTA